LVPEPVRIRCQAPAGIRSAAAAAGLKPIVRGHRLLRQWADGDEICSWYDVDLQTPVKSGAVTMSEWHAVREGKLVSGRVVFDAAALRAFLPSQ
jgi:hypothetical protein